MFYLKEDSLCSGLWSVVRLCQEMRAGGACMKERSERRWPWCGHGQVIGLQVNGSEINKGLQR